MTRIAHVAIEVILKLSKLRATAGYNRKRDLIVYMANTAFLHLSVTRAVKLLPLARKSNPKCRNWFM